MNVCVCSEGAWPEHHCKVADGALLNETIPKEKDGSYSKCKIYDDDYRNKSSDCNEWEYNFGDIGNTIASEVIERSMLC